MNNLIYLFITIILIGCKTDNQNPDPIEESARYKVNFRLNWNNVDFPADYPSNAHFSRLIGWSHNPNSDFFHIGSFASDGIKRMAESGAISPLDEEINTRIVNNEGLNLVIGEGLGSGVGEIIVEIDVDNKNPSVTLATMLAPSPDWYVAVVNINLYPDGKFVQEKIVNGLVYDAGTDSGITFKSANTLANPQEEIFLIVKPPLGNGILISQQISEVKFTKI